MTGTCLFASQTVLLHMSPSPCQIPSHDGASTLITVLEDGSFLASIFVEAISVLQSNGHGGHQDRHAVSNIEIGSPIFSLLSEDVLYRCSLIGLCGHKCVVLKSTLRNQFICQPVWRINDFGTINSFVILALTLYSFLSVNFM